MYTVNYMPVLHDTKPLSSNERGPRGVHKKKYTYIQLAMFPQIVSTTYDTNTNNNDLLSFWVTS